MGKEKSLFQEYIAVLDSFKSQFARETFRSRVIGNFCKRCPVEFSAAVRDAERSTVDEYCKGEGKG